MGINYGLLIAAPILQDYFSDNATDAAMSNGVITCYQDNSRTTLKNWYYQTGQPGAYTYTQLPNPLVLSAAGTITDANGNDTIPFWYPYSEADNVTPQPYYVTVDNSNGQRQFTRQNFPFVPPSSTSNEFLDTLSNLIVNNVFWRNAGSLTLTNTLNTRIAPSQHDGFIDNMSDMTFVKDATGATDTITFTQFNNTTKFPNNPDQTSADANPEYYMNVACGNTGSTETVKYVQIPICLHVANLSEYTNASVTIWTQNVAGSPNNNISLNLYQFLGTGASSPAAVRITPITTSTTWIKTDISFAFPTATIPAGGPGDDAWFLQIAFPVGVQFSVNIAKPSIYLSLDTPTNDFQTYEEVSGTIDAPRTGDIRTSLNAFSPFGWTPMNDGTIGNASSNATRANVDTWPLFSLLWTSITSQANGTNGGGTGYAQLYNSAGGILATVGASAIADWNANRKIGLTKTLGRALASVGLPSSGTNTGTTWALGQTTGNENVTIATANLPSHTHDHPIGTSQYIGTNAGTVYTNNGSNLAGVAAAVTGDVTGLTNSAMTTQPPTTYLNVFIKL